MSLQIGENSFYKNTCLKGCVNSEHKDDTQQSSQVYIASSS